MAIVILDPRRGAFVAQFLPASPCRGLALGKILLPADLIHDGGSSLAHGLGNNRDSRPDARRGGDDGRRRGVAGHTGRAAWKFD